MNTFVITNAKPINKNSLIGRFDLQLPSGMVIRDMLLLESNGRRWCNFPAEKYEKPDGTAGWKPLIAFADRETADKFQSQVTPLAVSALKPGPACEPASSREMGRQPPHDRLHNKKPVAFDDTIPF
jgi:hypothetical protein